MNVRSNVTVNIELTLNEVDDLLSLIRYIDGENLNSAMLNLKTNICDSLLAYLNKYDEEL